LKLPPAANHHAGKLFLSISKKIMYLIGFFILIFLLGSIPFGLLISRYWLKIDIRQQGSGNIGMTNVMRVGGKLPGLLTFVLDFGKGSAAVLLADKFTPALKIDAENQIAFLGLAGVTVVCGHVFSVFLHFKGGKGISTLFGVLAVLNLTTGICAAFIWVGMFIWKRISSLSGITMLATLPLLFLLIPLLKKESPDWPVFFMFLLLSFLLLYKHRENINRLLKGQEGKLSAGEIPDEHN
jgi:glycerol-3-phosphate acyltransferase PlsY